MSSWSEDKSRKRIETRLAEVETVDIRDYVKDTNLSNIGNGVAYRVDGVHVYVDIKNFLDILSTTGKDGTQAQKRALRFLDLHFRAVHRILNAEDVVMVDFHNQRLHAVVTKPYGTDREEDRVYKAIAVAKLISDVLEQTGDADESIPNAAVRVGIDTGIALAVNNGRPGFREPLFLGRPANEAAKHAAGSGTGIYLTDEARAVINLPAVDRPKKTSLTASQIETSQSKAGLTLTVAKAVKDWKEEMKGSSINDFIFTRAKPPLANLDFDSLSAANSRSQDVISVYADIDGFTNFVSRNLDNGDNEEAVVRILHVLRSELDAVIKNDFGGHKVRFIGDCVHGLLCEGTAHTTDVELTVKTATRCSGALRSAFELALEMLEGETGLDLSEIGLAIGFEYGLVAVTRLGMKGSLIRTAIGRSVWESEERQKVCKGNQTAIGQAAYDNGSESVRTLFSDKRIVNGLTYDKAEDGLKKAAVKTEGNSLLRKPIAASAAAAPTGFTREQTVPSKLDEFG